MCQSYRKPCACGQKTSEIFFGKMILDEAAVRQVYCPECSATVDVDEVSMVSDNGWILELDAEVLRAFAPRMQLDADTLTAEKVFDEDYATWVGFSPEDNMLRSKEREEIAKSTKGDTRAQFEALKRWAIDREKRFQDQGWRKAKRKPGAH
ncbi:MAG: hypothetical protein HGA98_00150 [Deltaproteobacteria bacterium]|nr:hypothetical protein [Deltaproteobacteria bacterium]